jgi:hypothetical protein
VNVPELLQARGRLGRTQRDNDDPRLTYARCQRRPVAVAGRNVRRSERSTACIRLRAAVVGASGSGCRQRRKRELPTRTRRYSLAPRRCGASDPRRHRRTDPGLWPRPGDRERAWRTYTSRHSRVDRLVRETGHLGAGRCHAAGLCNAPALRAFRGGGVC